ncbi:DUF4349 domain-containing protein [Flavobacterium longum]
MGVALLLLAAFACAKSGENAEAAEEAKTLASSSAASTTNDQGRQFIRTADMKFKVKDVAQSTYAIENTVQKFGGFVTHTNLQSVVSQHKETQVSPDSTLQTTKFTVENNLTFRVPNHRLDTVVKSIAKQVDYLDFRVIKAEDASLQLLANNMAQHRTDAHRDRMQNAIDKQPRKLNDIANSENDLLDKQETADNTKLESLSLKDKVAYSTVTLALYQNEKVRQELVANEKSVNAYRPHIGLQIWDSFKTGWFILEGILAFIAQLWSLILLALIGIFLFRKYSRKAKPAL